MVHADDDQCDHVALDGYLSDPNDDPNDGPNDDHNAHGVDTAQLHSW